MSPAQDPGRPDRDDRADAEAWEGIVRQLRGDPPVDDEDGDWHPEDPGDVTAGLSPATVAAWVLLVVTASTMVILGLVLDGLPWWLWLPGLALLLGSLLHLFRSLPEQRGEEDDGARV